MDIVQHNLPRALAALLLAWALASTATTARAQQPGEPAPGGDDPPPSDAAAEPTEPADGAPADEAAGAEPGAEVDPADRQPEEEDAPLMGAPPPQPKGATAPAKVATPPPAKGGAGATVAPPPSAPAPEEKKAAPPGEAEGEERPSEIYAEDWWSTAHPVLELHGYYRVRAEFFYNFALGRVDVKPMWPQPADKSYIDLQGTRRQVELCGDDPQNPEPCDGNTNMGANMRFRLTPELHISDNLRVMTQIDLLDNLVLGSTPDGYVNRPGEDGGYAVVARGGYSPTSAFSTTQWAPQAGWNSIKDSILVKRVWGEYATPLGQLRFGRMPSNWGLGILANAGDGHDSDWQSTVDAIMFVTGIKAWDLYAAFRLDFANEGPSSASISEQQGQPYDVAQQDDVDQYVWVLVRRRNPELARRDLAQGSPVFNGGGYFVYRKQNLANDVTATGQAAAIGESNTNIASGYLRRGAEAFIPDVWFQFLYEKFRLELEATLIWGTIENTSRVAGAGTDYPNPADPADPGWNVRQFGMAAETEYRAIEDRLQLMFKFGYATGDDDVESLAPTGEGLQPQLTADRTFSTFRFHPDYRVDLILFRNILTRVQGAYFFRPSVAYDFFRDPDGQKIGGSAALIWSRAAQFVQTPGHARDLGVELNFKLYFQAADGVLNDDPEEMGGFYTSLEYGVLFPLDGLGYMDGQVEDYKAYQEPGDEVLDTATAQTVRWYLGILF